jgi:hypothetical protein
MPREIDFHSAFCAQFNSTTSFTNTLATTSDELAPSDFPAFSLQFGKTNYFGPDNDGYLHLASQDFTLRVFYQTPQLKLDAALATRSSYVSIIESFVSHSFFPTPFSGIENYRITKTELLETMPPVYDKLMTTHTITIKGRYHYVFV